MKATKRLQLFIDKDVLSRFTAYRNAKYGPNPRNTSAVVQGILVEKLKVEGFWPPPENWAPEKE